LLVRLLAPFTPVPVLETRGLWNRRVDGEKQTMHQTTAGKTEPNVSSERRSRAFFWSRRSSRTAALAWEQSKLCAAVRGSMINTGGRPRTPTRSSSFLSPRAARSTWSRLRVLGNHAALLVAAAWKPSSPHASAPATHAAVTRELSSESAPAHATCALPTRAQRDATTACLALRPPVSLRPRCR
jgi:hypothetical protein